MTMDQMEQRRIVIIDARLARHELLQKRLGPSFHYDDYIRGSDAYDQLCHNNADIAMVFVGDDLNTDVMDMMLQMRRHGFSYIDAVLLLDRADEKRINQGYRSGYDLVLMGNMDEEAFSNVIEWRLMRSRQLKETERSFTEHSILHEKGTAVVSAVISEGMYRRLGGTKLQTFVKKTYMYEMLRSLQKEEGYYRCSEADIDPIVQASALYDVGMLEVPDEIVRAERPLTEEEKEIVRRHCSAGRALVKECVENVKLPVVGWSETLCLYHHERYDGKGYPSGLAGHDIPLAAAVCGIVDAYLALRNTRPWRPACRQDQAMDMIRHGECGVFDPVLVEHLGLVADRLEHKRIDITFESTDVIHQMQSRFYQEACSRSTDSDETAAVSQIQFLAELSHDIIFEYTSDPSVLYLSEHASDKFGLPSRVENPLMDARIRTILDKHELEKIWQKIVNLKDHYDRIREDVKITYRGRKQWNRIIAAPTYRNGVLTGCIGVMNNVDGEHQIMDSLTYQAVHDPLTGLYNRNYFRSRAKELLEEHPFLNYAFVEMDVDHFKQINDTYGHTAGDQVLMRLGRIMKECTRREDMAVRLGGDEFLLFYIMDEVPDAPVKRLFERVKEDREGIPFTISCGITTTVLSGRDYEKLYRDADQALYEAKKDGRNCYRIYKENK